MATMVTVWGVCCCKLLHIKVHDICHIQYKKSVSIVSMNMTSISVPIPSQGQVLHLVPTSMIESFVYLVAMENEIIELCLCLDMLPYGELSKLVAQ